jgi:hypothetical protein
VPLAALAIPAFEISDPRESSTSFIHVIFRRGQEIGAFMPPSCFHDEDGRIGALQFLHCELSAPAKNWTSTDQNIVQLKLIREGLGTRL